MGRKRERINTSGEASFSQDNPFGALGDLGLPEAAPRPQAPEPEPTVKPRETLLLRRLKSGKGGKIVTEVSGFDADPDSMDRLLKQLQGQLGAGGTRKGKVLELQGECRDRIKPLLESKGYRVKGA
ncbi:MAG: translation initiation factor [Opitutales bacterium]